jgi:carbamoyl-phosphate synthase large subunit
MKNKEKITIAVSGLNAIDSPGPGIPVIRGLRESDHFSPRIIGLAYDNLEPGIYMQDLVDRVYTVPYPSEGSEAILEKIRLIHEQERIDIIIPNFDAEIAPYIKISPALNALDIKTLLPTASQFEERQKHNLTPFGRKYDISVPESIMVNSPGELEKAVSSLGLPVMVKGKYYEAVLVYHLEEAAKWFYKISAKWGLPIILQQYLPGEEYNVAGLGDGEGNTIAAVCMRKQYITDKGKAWGGISISDPRLIELTGSFVKKTQWRGPFELEMIKDKRGDYHLLEINPRMPAWIYLAVRAGQNIPDAIIQLTLKGHIPPLKNYMTGKMFLRYSWDMIIDVAEFQKFSMKGER